MTEQLKALAEAATKGEWAVVDGHYPSFKELTGPSFSVSVVMFATDLTDADTDQREADLQYIAFANPERILALIAENERLRGVLDEIATINSLTATQPQFIRYLQNTAQAALCHGKDPDYCWNTRCNLGHKCRSALGETK